MPPTIIRRPERPAASGNAAGDSGDQLGNLYFSFRAWMNEASVTSV